MTAHHLRDMLAQASVAQLLAWSAEPGLLPRVPAGPDRGKPWRELDGTTLDRLAADRDEDIRFSAAHELTRRNGPDAAPPAPRQPSLL